MIATLILWAHALAALLFGALALSQIQRAGTALPRLAFLVALSATALWALAIAGIGAGDLMSWIAESVRNIAWLAFMVALVRRNHGAPAGTAVGVIYGIVLIVVVMGGGLSVLSVALAGSPDHAGIEQVAMIMRMLVAVAALVLVDHLYQSVAPAARDGIRLAAAALAGMWILDLGLYTLAYLGIGEAPTLTLIRGAAMVVLAPLFAVAVHRNGDWTLHLSRTVAYQSLSMAAVGLYILAMVLGTSALGAIGAPYGRIVQTAFVLGSTTAIVTILSTPWLRAWIKVKLAKHFFSHRYDYRAEWLRFTDTLGKPGDGAAPLEVRIVKAVADLTDSPAGLLLVPDGSGLGQGAAWNWDAAAVPTQSGEAGLARYLESTSRIIALDAVRGNAAEAAEMTSVPIWMLDRADAWVLVPLVHFGKLAGAILLARPPIDRRPDWEDLDLLRIAGRQVASYLAEARAQEALSDAQRFDEFNRRFAFIMHDIKNLVSQLSLVARNAERHADNPEFRADMVATLKDSAARMNDLLARLSQHNTARPDALAPVEIVPLIERVAALRRVQHPIATAGLRDALVLADPVRLEQLLGHLLQNAIEASPPGDPITVMVAQLGETIAIDVVDHGCGMSPVFIRDKLFKPFVSSKVGGFGLGAFEAQQLAEAMGGRVEVFSREGEGTRFRVSLPQARTGAGRVERAA
ncbi:XrtA/PEP-CTERM system histidine kinase PrsK [Sphingomonas sp. 28-63-12]|uniref:XrtA/PEP-CTERM system histidine kinase PrsK n=1 Tax=Sphingomonas sp. 28-63-12 TaxID=1970434 RepID=UPI000BC5DDDE|nr:MAG: histidine kinase [Sphingomonas sp. 28-63-12]